MDRTDFDVIIVGGGIAGCTAAVLYAREGLKVALIERNQDQRKFKKFCTHYIQASATPTIRRLGIDKAIEAKGAIRNSANLWTRFGWMNEPDMFDHNGELIFGYNIRREVLDPELRDLAQNTVGIEYLPGTSVKALIRDGERVSGVQLNDEAGTKLAAKLVVAADGRNSKMAELADVPTKLKPNRRAGIFAHYQNLKTKTGDKSLMWLSDRGAAYIFQNDHDVSVLTAMPDKDEWPNFEADPEGALLDFLKAMPDAPNFEGIERVSEVIKMKDYPNLSRPAAYNGMALVGDTATSADPLFGVGCGWAFQTAEWAVDATLSELKQGKTPSAGLRSYKNRHRSFIGPHAFLLADNSRRKHFNFIEKLMFSAAAKDQKFAEHVFRFATKIDSVWQFLTPSALLSAIRINLSQKEPAKLKLAN